MMFTLPVCFSCQGVSDVAVSPTERCTAAFQSAQPHTALTPPTNPTTAAPYVRPVRVTQVQSVSFSLPHKDLLQYQLCIHYVA